MQSASLLGNAFDEVAAYFGELLGFGARRGGCGTIEPLLRLFQAIERNNCNSTRWRSLSGCNLPAENDVCPSERLEGRRRGFNDVEKCCLIRHLQCLGNPKGWRYVGLGMQRAETDAAENEAARQCSRQLDLRGHIRPSLSVESPTGVKLTRRGDRQTIGNDGEACPPDHQDSGLRFLGPIGSKKPGTQGPGGPDSLGRITRPIRFLG